MILLFINSKLDLIRTVKFVKLLFRTQIQKGGKVLLWNQVKYRMEACYSELVLACSLAPTELCILQPRIYTLEVFFTYKV